MRLRMGCKSEMALSSMTARFSGQFAFVSQGTFECEGSSEALALIMDVRTTNNVQMPDLGHS